ncbi:MAG: hypothetical protein ACRDGA_00010 [Bacteroidota bacterium]
MHGYTPLQLSLLAWMFSYWHDSPFSQRMVLLSIPVFFSFWVIALLFFENLYQFGNFTNPLASLLLLTIASFTLLRLHLEKANVLLRHPGFWVSSGAVIYFSTMIFLQLLSNLLLTESVDLLRAIWSPVQAIASVISNLLFAFSFLCLRFQ